ncbi:hypothetical protein Avbf_17478 [Armadillidium vulgare]|nr:hypothetical protein Avbf_17478 [Armadillidium vulgare]
MGVYKRKIIVVSEGDSSFLFVNESISENSTLTTTGKSLPDGIEPTTKETSTTTQTIPSFFATKKPESLVGWLQNPKREVTTTTHNPIDNNLVKDGFCGNKHDYGIRCGKRMDQCKRDSNCPGVTKCCLVSDCGFLCVRPKAKRKHHMIQKKKTIKEKRQKGSRYYCRRTEGRRHYEDAREKAK